MLPLYQPGILVQRRHCNSEKFRHTQNPLDYEKSLAKLLYIINQQLACIKQATNEITQLNAQQNLSQYNMVMA